MPSQIVNYIRLYYEVSGRGQPLVFIHGLGSSTRDWDAQTTAFAGDYRVITFDLRGHGQSDKPAGPYTMPLFAADLAGLLASLGIDSAHLVGISLGGGVALQCALDAPGLVRTLTIVNSGPSLGGSPEHAQQEIDRRVGIVQQHGMRAMGAALGPGLFPQPEHAALRAAFAERWADNDPQAYIAATRALLGWDVTDRLDTLRCPTLIVAADQDYTPVAAKEAYAKRLPDAQLVVIPDSHHALPIERPEAFNSILAAFLAHHR